MRINPLMAAVQKTKVRPILNLSKGYSFNDAVDPFGVDKLKMSSAKLFAEAIIRAGQGAIMAKTDIKDAYKIPNAKTQWRLYGFRWLNKYFFDISTVFGSQAAPACFDCLPETIVNIICCQNKITRKWIPRQLDDVPIVSPKESGWTNLFYEKYQNICKEINVPLAENCIKHEKAFGLSTFGTELYKFLHRKNGMVHLRGEGEFHSVLDQKMFKPKNLHSERSAKTAWQIKPFRTSVRVHDWIPFKLNGTD
jgi:hypothetical protein